jgi:hypothetical protein
MKYISLSVLMLLTSTQLSIAMEQEGQKKHDSVQDVSPEVDEVDFNLADEACYLWMKKQEKDLGIPYQELSSDDQKVFDQLVKYKDNPEAVKRSRYNWANIVCNKVKAAGRDLPYDNNTVGETLLKMSILMHSGKIKKPKTELTIRMAATKELTPEEMGGWTETVFKSSRTKSEETVLKWADIAANTIAKIKLIENTPEAIEQKKQQLFEEKIADMERAYTKKN